MGIIDWKGQEAVRWGKARGALGTQRAATSVTCTVTVGPREEVRGAVGQEKRSKNRLAQCGEKQRLID